MGFSSPSPPDPSPSVIAEPVIDPAELARKREELRKRRGKGSAQLRIEPTQPSQQGVAGIQIPKAVE